jgi:tetratricopeptide (TPR) repeat protein
MGNKTARVLGVVIILLCDHALLWAQAPRPARDAAAPTDGEGKPWNRGTTLAVREAANARFLEGNRLFDAPLFAQAAAQYKAALRTWPHPAFHYNLALAQLNLGQDVEAREHLERAVQYGEEPLGAAEFAEAQRQLAALERQLGRITITCQTPGAVVSLDGVAVFTAPGRHQAWVMPQPMTHELTARKPEYLSKSKQISVAPGALEQVELELITLEEAADANRRWATWKPWVVVGAGAATAAGGGVFHRLSARNVDRYDAEAVRLGCANDAAMPGCHDGQLPAELRDQLGRARQQHTVAVTGYITGGVVAAAGIVMLWLNRPRLDEEAPPSRGRRVVVVPAVSSDTFSLLVRIDP